MDWRKGRRRDICNLNEELQTMEKDHPRLVGMKILMGEMCILAATGELVHNTEVTKHILRSVHPTWVVTIALRGGHMQEVVSHYRAIAI